MELESFEIGVPPKNLSYASSASCIALAWGRLKSCPNHELSREIIIQNFYARVSRNAQTMLDTSCAGSFMKKTIEFRWDLLEIIKHNSEDWELDEG